MAKYERFLSYLFEYKGDHKGINCGFARIEIRGEITRIQIVVKGRDSVDLLQVCGFYRKNGYCVRVPLGRMMISGGNGQFQYQMTGIWIGESQVAFEQLAGLVLNNSKETGSTAYATVWDDEPFGLSMFQEDGKDKEEVIAAQQQLEHFCNSETVKKIEVVEGSGEEQKPEAVEGSGEEQKTEAIKESGEEQKPEAVEGSGEEQKPEAVEGSGEEQKTEAVEESGEEQKIEAVEESRKEQKAEAVQDNEKTQEIDTISDSEDVLFAESCDVSAKAAVSEDEYAADADLFWAGLCKRFRRIETLPQEKEVCLKAMPADIGRLPRQNWILGNNGFLIYSFVRYRYIVFARVKRDAFELWIPGTYEKNEERLAKMFGFSRFRSMKSKNPQRGDFGYWCIPLSYRDEEEIYPIFMKGQPRQQQSQKEKGKRESTVGGRYGRRGTAEAG